MSNRTYRSDAMASAHETMEALHDIVAVDKQTMRRFDEACLTPIRLLTAELRELQRDRNAASE